MAAKLKVFVTSDGLTDYVVATSSRPKALAAWGVRQDLFKEGRAHESEDPQLVEAALAQPGEVLRRPAGTRTTLAKAKPLRKPKPAQPSKAALRKVEQLEKRIAAAEAAHVRALEDFERARAELEARIAAEAEAYEGERARLEGELGAARRAIRED